MCFNYFPWNKGPMKIKLDIRLPDNLSNSATGHFSFCDGRKDLLQTAKSSFNKTGQKSLSELMGWYKQSV